MKAHRVLAGLPLAVSVLVVAGCARGSLPDPAGLARACGLEWTSGAAAGEKSQALADARAGANRGVPTWPKPVPDGPAAVTEQFPVRQLHPTSGFAVDGCWLAASDGAFEAEVPLRGGPVAFRLRLKAIRQVGDWPEVRFLLNGREIGRCRLDANAPDMDAAETFISHRYRWVEVSAHAEAAPGVARLKVDYACSHFDPVERIGIRGILFDRLLVVQRPESRDACGSQAAETAAGQPAGRKVLLVGLDGASWSILLPLVNRGLLPNLAGLLEQGAYGPLDSAPMTYSPAVWNTIYTGQPRESHGIDQMTAKAAGSYEAVAHSTRSLRAATLWQMLSVAGSSVLAVGMNTTWPAQPVHGVIVSDRLLGGRAGEGGGGVWPISQEGPVGKALAALQSTSLIAEDLPEGLRSSAARDAEAVELARAYLSGGQPDLTAVYIALPDHAGHLLWSDHAPFGVEHRFDGARPRLSSAPDGLERACIVTDRLVGRLLEGVDRARTAVVLVSDHSTDLPDAVTTTRFRLASLLRAVAGESAYVPFEETWIVAHIYLNLRGREPRGIVDPAEASAKAEHLREELLALRTVSDKKVFEDVRVPPREAAVKARALDYEPADLVGIVNGSIDPSDVIRLPGGLTLPASQVLHRLDSRSGTHDRFGVLVVSGNGARSGAIVQAASILDVAPTVLALLGLPRAADMPGRPIEEALAEGVSSPCFIPSYFPLVPATAFAPQRPAPLSPEELERLRGLGYVQ